MAFKHVKTLPSGKRLHNYRKIHHFQWENPRTKWSFSIAMLNYQRVSFNMLKHLRRASVLRFSNIASPILF